jgi:nitrite reductase/ring-hydroxylating ferredoxin subunit
MAEWFVAKAAELSDGDRRIVTAGPNEIGVFFKDGAFYAYSNYCLHSGGPACEGLLINRVVDLIATDRTYEGQSFGDEMQANPPYAGRH